MLEAGRDPRDVTSKEKALETHSEKVETDTVGGSRLTSLGWVCSADNRARGSALVELRAIRPSGVAMCEKAPSSSWHGDRFGALDRPPFYFFRTLKRDILDCLARSIRFIRVSAVCSVASCITVQNGQCPSSNRNLSMNERSRGSLLALATSQPRSLACWKAFRASLVLPSS